jgi:heme-degrading monooxygenase HmoA
VIVEYVRYELPASRCAAFEVAYARAGGILDGSPSCLGWELRRSVEEPGHYMVRIEWDSIEGHVEGFRKSEPFQAFIRELGVFADCRLEMAHFELVEPAAAAASPP